MFTYQFGPVARIPFHRVTIFGLLFGGDSTTPSISATAGFLQQEPKNTFARADIRISKKVAIRLPEPDYFRTQFTSSSTLAENQNNFRYLTGIVFRSR
jgi:hypothetical protein